MRAIWRALTVNERRVSRAIAVTSTPLHSEETAAAVGIQRSSIGNALESLLAKADVIQTGDGPMITDPMFELWLQRRGLTPADGGEYARRGGPVTMLLLASHHSNLTCRRV